MLNKNLKYILILIVLSYFFFIFGNSTVSLTNPDEVFYTLSAKEMVQHKTWMTPILFNQPQFEKPIMVYWLLRLGFILFGGINSFAARFFPALFASLGVLAVYFLSLCAFRQEKKAFTSALVLLSSGLYIGLGRTVFTDMIFTVLILCALACFYWGYTKPVKKGMSLMLSFVFMALAVLTKGPLGFFIPFLTVCIFLSVRKEIRYLFCKEVFWGALIFVLVSFPWYILMIGKYGSSFTHEFFYNDHIRRLLEAEHVSNDRWYFYPFAMAGCMFPWSIFLLAALFGLFKQIRKLSPGHLFLISWIAVVFLIFQFAHSKLVSYIFPLFPALALVTGDFIYNTALLEHKKRTFFVIALISALILLFIPVGLKVCLKIFPGYLSLPQVVYIFIAVFSLLLAALFYCILRRKFFKAIYLFAAVLPVFLAIVPFIHKDIEPYVSSKYISDYLMEHYPEAKTIICSKMYCRGVRFYTGKDVAGMNVNFFSPHPITYLNYDGNLKDFLSTQPVTYCILKKSAVKDMERVTSGLYKCVLLKQFGDEYLLRVEKEK